MKIWSWRFKGNKCLFLSQKKDESIVELTNKLHEIELNSVQTNAVVAAAVLNNSSSPSFNQSASNGIENGPEAIKVEETQENGEPSKSPGPLSLSAIATVYTAAKKFQTVNNNSGVSFDSEKMMFREYVAVGTQTNPKGHQSGAEITPSR